MNRLGSEAVLSEQPDHFQLLVENVQDIITVIDRDAVIQYASPAAKTIMGYDTDEVVGRVAFSYVCEDDLPGLLIAFDRAFSEPDEVSSARFRFRHADGSWRHLEARAKAVSSSGDGVTSIVVTSRDVTDRVLAEEALNRGEQVFRGLFENSPDAIFVESLDGYVLDVNLAAAKLHRCSRDDLIGKHVTELVPDRIRDDVRRQFEDGSLDGRGSFESLSLTSDGIEVPVELSVQSFHYRSRPAQILIVRDISRRKAAEEEVVRLKQFYQTILDELPADLAVLDIDGRMVYLNPSSVGDPEMREWLIGKTGHDYCLRRGIDPAIADYRVERIDEAVERRETVTFEETLTNREGERRHILRLASPIIEQDGSIRYVIGYGLDITDLKEAEEALRRSEGLFRGSFHGAAVGMVIASLDSGRLVDVNLAFQDMLGYTYDELRGLSYVDLTHPEDRETSQREFQRLFRRDVDHFQIEKRYVAKSGRVVWARTTVTVVEEAQAEGPVSVAMIQDITAWKQAQAALRSSEALLRTVLANMPVAVIVADRKGVIKVVEGQGLGRLGLHAGVGAGQTVREVFSQTPQIALGLEAAIAGRSLNQRVEVGDHSIEFWYSALGEEGDENLSVVVAVAADISEITRKERALRESREQLRQLAARLESIREEERTRIAREVHDVLGQSMTGLRMDVASISKKLKPGQADLRRRLEAMNSLIADTIKTVRRISTELRPGILDDLGLAAAIQWQAKEFENRTEIACMVSDETEVIRVDKKQATALFRILQEILTNVARHANASSVEILLREMTDVFEMRIRDDGIGISEQDVANPHSLGLLGIRERLAPWGGRVTFRGRSGAGTTVSVTMPFSSSDR